MDSLTLGTRIAIRSRTPKQFGILIGEPARAPHGNYHWKVRTLTISFTIGNPGTGTFAQNLAKAGGGGLPGRPAELQTLKETDLLTPRGGFFDARNQNRDPEPSAKTIRDSD